MFLFFNFKSISVFLRGHCAVCTDKNVLSSELQLDVCSGGAIS